MRAIRRIPILLGVLVAWPIAGRADDPEYPVRPVRIITAGAGTIHDILTRQIARELTERWGQSVVVENQPAAAMTVGSRIAARATPDGYTLLMSDRSALAVAPHLFPKLPYDPTKDFAPITLVALSPQLLVAHPSVPADSLREFIAYAKQRPGVINYASAGPGTVMHVAGEMFKQLAGIDLVAVQYKGGAAAMLGMLSSEASIGFLSPAVVWPQVAAGKLKAYAITSSKRFSGTPDIPTAIEAGLPGFESEQWIGMLAPARTPVPLIARLNRDIVQILNTTAMQSTLRAQGAEPAPGTPAEFAAFIRSETTKYGKVVQIAGMHVE